MMMNNTLAQLRDLKLAGMASAVEEQLSSAASTGLSFEERLALMVDREVPHHRHPCARAGEHLARHRGTGVGAVDDLLGEAHGNARLLGEHCG